MMKTHWSIGAIVGGFTAVSCGKMDEGHMNTGGMSGMNTGGMSGMNMGGMSSMNMGGMGMNMGGMGMNMGGMGMNMGGMGMNMAGMGSMQIPAAAPMLSPPAWSGELSVPEVKDDNPDPHVVEVSLVAAPTEIEYLPGKKSSVWAYNGMVPGPTIRASVGDEVIVHFTNKLPEPTSIHWHGVRVPNEMDGAQNVRAPVPAGGTFDYRFRVPDAGNFWYHPHVRSDVQVHRGLYAALIVEDPAGPAIQAASDDVVILNDVQIAPGTGALDDTEDMRAQMMGREGNLAVVNGRRSNLELSVRAGEARRLRLVNAANARYFRLALDQGVMTRLGGEELLEAPERVDEVLLAPGMRADVLVWLDQANSTATLRALPYQRAMGAAPTESIDLVRFVASSEPAETPPALPARLQQIAVLDTPATFKELRFSERVAMGEQQFLINGEAYPEVPILTSNLGTVEQWRIVNESDMDHPFHIHGFQFQVVGQREWKDTVNVPTKMDVTLRIDFKERPGAAGNWFYHCHILEHAERGMMGEVTVL
ncbi:MAG: multicopper oxidase family protein [Polyangiaceae bacterium]